MNNTASIKVLALAVLAASFAGCATVGGLTQVAGTLTGQKGLTQAGKSMRKSAKEFTEEEKYYTGRTVAAHLLTNEKPASNAQLEKYLNRVGQNLALASGAASMPHGWHFILLEGDAPNAYAAPGGLIFVSRGLVALCESEDELAGVLAHEISHVAADHPMKAISAANRKAALAQLAQWGVSQSMKKNGNSNAAAEKMFGKVVEDIISAVGKGYDRKSESEADLMAVEMVAEMGYEPAALGRVLRRLKKGDASHGNPKHRASAVDRVAADLGEAPGAPKTRLDRFAQAVK